MSFQPVYELIIICFTAFEECFNPNNIDFFIVWTKGFTDASHVWKDMRMSKWWQNFHFWVIYWFPVTEYLRYKTALLMWIKRWHAWHKQMCLKGHVGYFMAFFSKDSSWVPGEGCIEVFPQTHPDVWACFPNDAEQMAFKRLSTWLSLTYKRQSLILLLPKDHASYFTLYFLDIELLHTI